MWLPFILVVPYLVGIAWHVGLHPTASVFTGDFAEARRWYIDENSLDPGNFRMNKRYNVIRNGGSINYPDAVNTMCGALEDVGVHEDRDGAVVTCHESEQDLLHIVSVVPSNTAISPAQEAVVIVVPFSDRWLTNQLHYSILQLIKRLANPDMSSAPWMGSKTVVFLSPMNNETIMHGAVQRFLNLESSRGFIIRNVLVLDRASWAVPTTSGAPVELRVLPQGRLGLLPNMDLVFLMYRVFSQIPARQLQLNVHPFPEIRRRLEMTWWWRAMFQTASPKWQNRLLDLILFEYALAAGTVAATRATSPFLPHSPALDLGIDSVTLQLAYDSPSTTAAANGNNNAIVAEVVSKLEPAIRALCNLHERLHHSTRLYLLVSPDRFVKHEEYLVPNLLLLIPFIIRAVSLALVDIRRFDLAAVGRAAATVVGGVLGCSFGLHAASQLEAQGTVSFMDATLVRSATVLVTAYLPLLWYLWRKGRSNVLGSRTDESKSSIQFLACLVGLYLHVAIAFGHVSLAFPSAAWWTPLIAFPYHRRIPSRRRALVSLVNWTVFIATSPFVWLVPFVFSEYTPYVQYLYLPLHMFVAILLL
jgi:GPI-anchor transamidase subunit GAA1